MSVRFVAASRVSRQSSSVQGAFLGAAHVLILAAAGNDVGLPELATWSPSLYKPSCGHEHL